MPLRAKFQVALTLLAAIGATVLAARLGSTSWLAFWLLLIAVLISSGMKVVLPRGDGTMSLNFPFILLGIVQLSPLQAILLAGLSVAAQCRIRVRKIFTAVQICFNVANAMLSTACAYAAFTGLQKAHVEIAPALAVASLAYFLWNTLSVAMVLGATKGESVVQLWRREYPWYLPFYVVGAVLAAAISLLSVRFGWSTALLLLPLVYTLYRAYMGQVSRLQERQQHLEETEALHLRTIEGLAMAIEAKDQNTHDHLFRVRQYVKAVGEGLKLSKLELQALETAAFLHDIGKLAVPEQIINKPGKLTPEEFEKMKIHPVVGADILERVRFPYPVVPIVRSHHEWWDGCGYPDGLRGEDIPIGARILTVVDCFDALTSDRPYRKGMSDEKALDLLNRLAGTQFDPRVVDAFRSCYAQMEVRDSVDVAGFTPLNTEVEVWRGEAPGAGFEAGSEAEKDRASRLVSVQPSQSESSEELITLIAAADPRLRAGEDFACGVRAASSIEELTQALRFQLRCMVAFDACIVFAKHGEELTPEWAEGRLADAFGTGSIALGEGISGWVAQTGKGILNANASVEPGCPVAADGSPRLASALSVPVLALDGSVAAVLSLYSVRADSYRREDLQVMQDFAPKLLDFLGALARCKALGTESDTDPVTGLPGARSFFLQLETEVDRYRETQAGFAILLCRLQGLSTEDGPGQDAREALVKLTADQLRKAVSGAGSVVRLREDTIACALLSSVLSSTLDVADCMHLAVQDALQQVDGTTTVRPLVGVAFCPSDGVSVEEILAAAERRLHLEAQVMVPPQLLSAAGSGEASNVAQQG